MSAVRSLLKPAVELADEGIEAAKKTASEVVDTARDLFRSLVPDNPSISEEALAIHNAVESGVNQGLSKKKVYSEIGKLTGLTKTEIDANEKIFSRLSGGGASDNIIDEVRLVARALTTQPTGLQAEAKKVAGGKGTKSTRIAREKAGKAAIGAGTLGYLLGELDLPPEKASEFEQAFSKAFNAGEETFTFKGKEYSTEVKKGKAMGGSMLAREGFVEGSILDPESKSSKNVKSKMKAMSDDVQKVADAVNETPPKKALDTVLNKSIDLASVPIEVIRDGIFVLWDALKVQDPYEQDLRTGSKAGSLMVAPKREGYQSGSSTDDSSSGDVNLDEQVKFYTMLYSQAKTPEEKKQVNDSFGEMLPTILKTLQGGDDGKELFPKAGVGLGDSLRIKNPYEEDLRTGRQAGSLMVPPEMEQDMPVDTYPNIPPEEMAEAEASQLPDAEMEDKFIDFVMDESLEEEEQSYLMNALEADPKLSQIFDKVMTTASEFTGSGEVEGPGTGVSDSIPARLSDGEFVFTKKATDQMGADNLQMMMDDAERAFDGGEMREPAQEGGLLLYKQKDEDPLAYEKIAQDEIKKSMLRSNRAPSLNPGSI